MQNDIESDNDYLGGPGIPQPPEAPQPARPGGIPSWQQEPLRMIDDAMTRWTGPIKLEQDYEAVKNRLRYLEKYQPRLKGELLIRCDTAISLLQGRIAEFEDSNINLFLRKVSKLCAHFELTKGKEYLNRLQAVKGNFVGEYRRSINLHIEKLQKLINTYSSQGAK